MRQSSDRLRKSRMQDATLMALGGALQMYVHDVKRPFSMIQGILGLLASAPNSARLAELSTRYLPDVGKAVQAVDRLIQDILEIGSDAEPSYEDVSVSDLIEDVLREQFSLYAPEDLQFSYQFAHRYLLHADPQKIGRVFGNIVTNALEAMQRRGKLWFATEEFPAERTVMITIGNTGSYVPPEMLSELFDRFYTDGKKHGTGLGLAIVKKIVRDHGGEVWCASDLESGTRFSFTLPLAPAPVVDTSDRERLPRCAKDCLSVARAHADTAFVSALDELAARGGASVLIVDDDPLYIEVISALLTPEECQRAAVRFVTARNGEEALARLDDFGCDVAIVDVDLGPGVEDGLSVVSALREQAKSLRICVHSDGPAFELSRRAALAGADLFLPKPMSREHFLRLLRHSAATRASRETASLPELMRIAVVDDDALILETWEALPGYEWLSFDTPAQLIEASEKDDQLLASLTCVVTDFRFGPGQVDGAELAAFLIEKRADLPIFMATDHPAFKVSPPFGVKMTVPKESREALRMIESSLSIQSS